MAIERTTGIQLVDGIRALYAADADLVADVAATRIYAGPVGVDTQNQGGERSIKPRQINISIAPNIMFAAMVGEAVDYPIPVLIELFGPVNQVATGNASSGITDYDRMVHLQKLMMQGTIEAGSPNNLGKIINPDDPTNPDATQRYLNTEPPEFRTVAIGRLLATVAARVYAFLAVYEVQESMLTRRRV